MANPQTENGYTKLANEWLDVLIRQKLNGTDWAVLMFILRKTYGWQKKEDQISLSQFCKALPYTKPSICKSVNKLKLVKILLLVQKGKSKILSNRYAFNKNYDDWCQLVNKPKLVKKKKRTSKVLETQLVNKPLHTKETSYKRNLTKEIIPKGITAQPEISKNIDKILTALRQHLGIADFASRKVDQRNFGKHLWDLFENLGKEKFLERLDGLMGDNFKSKNLNHIDYLYREMKGYLPPKKKVNIDIT